MSVILNIETATNVCSVAVSSNGSLLFEKEDATGPSHATLLGRFVADALEFVRKEGLTLEAVAISSGPGSYTGLRIGVAEAKGLCYGLNIPLIAINTPEIMVNKVLHQNEIESDVLLCPMIDARRMEVYAGVYNNKIGEVRAIAADIVDGKTYLEYLNKGKVLFFGNGSEKCRPIIAHENAVFLDGVYPSANSMIGLSEKAFAEQRFADIAYFEPFYLKDFVATVPKNKVF